MLKDMYTTITTLIVNVHLNLDELLSGLLLMYVLLELLQLNVSYVFSHK